MGANLITVRKFAQATRCFLLKWHNLFITIEGMKKAAYD